jgi:ribosomal protein S18 acetylase RimI-like enzyme
VGKALLRELLQLGERLGCVRAGVMTDRTNMAALGLYQSVGGAEAPIPQLKVTLSLGVGHPAPTER